MATQSSVRRYVSVDQHMALLLSRADLDAGQHDRLAAVLAEWRRQGPQRLS